MKTLLTILSHGKADATLSRHWLYYVTTGCDLLVSSPVDDRSNVGIGFACGYSEHHGRNTVMRYYETFRHVSKLDYDYFIFIEYDCILLGPPKFTPKPGTISTHTFYDNTPKGFRGHHFFHCPWYFDAATLEKFLEEGAKLIARNEFELGFPDRWIGYVCEQGGIGFNHIRNSYSQNTIDMPYMIQEAREAVANGAWAIHGIKTKEQLEGVMG